MTRQRRSESWLSPLWSTQLRAIATSQPNSLGGSSQVSRLKDKVALVTGAAQGIGLAIAQAFVREGAVVIAGDVKPGFQIEGAYVEKLDVTSPEDWGRIVRIILDGHGRIDVLVNNAGIVGCYEPVHKTDVESWSRVVAVNQTGTFLGMHAVLPSMLSAKRGSIVNFSSIWGNAGVPGVAAYSATKGAGTELNQERGRDLRERERARELDPSRADQNAACRCAISRDEQRHHCANTDGAHGDTRRGGGSVPVSGK